ncbi:MAG: hypothetical protein JRH01_10565 [Deltaproteobacteria bacterium]|nr:hypothetical protein [Deltaproteobacteria bacterium]MBW2396221.1 hypothetical protein [Deltaproteobacteria bacterium]
MRFASETGKRIPRARSAVAALLFVAVVSTGGAAAEELRVGFGTTRITPEVPDRWTDLNGNASRDPDEPWVDGNGNGRFDPVYMAGFANGRAAAGVHDELLAVAAIFDDGERRIGVVTADVVGLSHGFVEALRDEVNDRLSLDYLLVHATHNHQGPDTQGLWGSSRFRNGIAAGLHRRLRARMGDALAQAVAALEPARIEALHVPSREAFGIVDTRLPDVIDEGVRAVIVRRPGDGTVIGTLLNFAVHVESLWDRNLELTADVAGYARRGVSAGLDYDGELFRRGLGGTTLWLTGNIGGLITTLPETPVVDPRDGRPRVAPSFEKARAQGYGIAAALLDGVDAGKARPVAPSRIGIHRHDLEVPLANRPLILGALLGILDRDLGWSRGVTTESEVALLTLGDVWIAAVPGELYPEIAVGGIEHPVGADFDAAPNLSPPWRTQMKGQLNLMVNLANDSLGYIIPRSQWDAEAPWIYGATQETYGEIVSAGPDTAGLLHRAFLSLFREASAQSSASHSPRQRSYQGVVDPSP